MNTIAFKQLLLEKGISQAKLAKQLNIDPKTLSQKVLGKKDFWAKELFQLVDILSLSSLDELKFLFEQKKN